DEGGGRRRDAAAAELLLTSPGGADWPGPGRANSQARRSEHDRKREGEPEQKARRCPVLRSGEGSELGGPLELVIREVGDHLRAQLGENRDPLEACVERVPDLAGGGHVFDVRGAEAEEVGEIARLRLGEALRSQAVELPRP